MADRTASVNRETGETKITVAINLDGSGKHQVSTGNGMLDHLVAQLSRHGLLDITLHAQRDATGYHHVAEDVGIVLGRALRQALGDGRGIRRMGNALVPLDEALVQVAVDLSGRGYAQIDMPFAGEFVEDLPAEVVPHVLESLAMNAGMNLHVKVMAGKNNHHIAEATFKALARALREALEIDPRSGGVPSTKGTISG
jgi:imidazoleglycerol-phosphate dehydratase